MSEHCRAPNSCRGVRGRNNPAAAEPELSFESLTRIRALEWAPGLPVLVCEPGPNPKTEQGQGDRCEWQRRQPDWHVVHIEGSPRVGCS
jgi:hypothetical protein